MDTTPQRIVEIAQRLRDGQSPKNYKVRAVLKWFGAERRGINVLSKIKTTLVNLGLEAQPDIDDVRIDDTIRFLLSPSLRSNSGTSSDGTSPTLPPDSVRVRTGDVFDFTTTESTLHSASETVTPSDDELEPEPDDEEPVTRPDDRPVTSQSSDWTISALRDKFDRGLLHLQPKFQREYVWGLRPELPSRLIESLLLEIPILGYALFYTDGRTPPLYFKERPRQR